MGYTVSIIVPVYKVEKYLDRCVASLTAQTHPDLEILLVDDGSPDRCPEMCDAWAQKDARIRVIHKENGGVSKARNLGMEEATGEYILFVDSDDYLPESAVAILLDRILRDGSDMAIGKLLMVFDNGQTDGSLCDFMEDRILQRDAFLIAMGSKPHYNVGPCGKLYSRKALSGIQFPPMTCGEDMWVFPHIILQCDTISVVAEDVYFYFQNTESVMHRRKDTQHLESIRATQHFAGIFLERGADSCAGNWFGFGVEYIQEMQNPALGVALMRELFSESQLRKLLKNASAAVRVKWFLLKHPRLYRLVFGIKHALLDRPD